MDAQERDEILDNEFADELELQDVVDTIESVYNLIDVYQCREKIEGHLEYLKDVLMDKTKEHEHQHNMYGSWWNKLAIVHCRNQEQKTFVTAIWDLILFVEMAFVPDDTSADSDMQSLLDVVLDTANECGLGARSFPLGHLVRELEYLCWDTGANPDIVQRALISLDLPFKKIYSVYRRLDFFDDDLDEGLTSHYLKAFASLIQSFIRKNNDLNMDENDRQEVLNQCRGSVEWCLNEMNDNEEDYTPRLFERYERLECDLKNLES